MRCSRNTAVRALPEDAIGRMVGDGAATLVARVFGAAGSAPPPDALDSLSRDLQQPAAEIHAPVSGHSRCAGGSWCPGTARRADEQAAAVDLRDPGWPRSRAAFPPAQVLGGDGPFPRKPDPAGLHHLIREAAATPDDTTMVGDSVIDWRTARAAGTHVCLVRYGFGFEGVPIGD